MVRSLYYNVGVYLSGNDHANSPPTPLGHENNESSRKSSAGDASKNLLWHEAKDVWFCQCDPVWGEFCGAKALDNRPVPLLDPIPLNLWVYFVAEDGGLELYALLDVPSLVTLQLNHYQNLFLMRLVDKFAAMSDVLAMDGEKIAKPGSKRRVCLGGMFPQVNVLQCLSPVIYL